MPEPCGIAGNCGAALIGLDHHFIDKASKPRQFRRIAKGGGGGKGDKGGGGGNAEITPLQVDPSVTFDTVGGLEHYIKVRTVRPMPACVCVSPAPV